MQLAVQRFHCATVLLLPQINQYPLHCLLELTRVLPDRYERTLIDVHRVETKVMVCDTFHGSFACSVNGLNVLGRDVGVVRYITREGCAP